MKDKSPHIKPLTFENAPNGKDLTQMGSILELMSSKDGVGNNPLKVPKG